MGSACSSDNSNKINLTNNNYDTQSIHTTIDEYDDENHPLITICEDEIQPVIGIAEIMTHNLYIQLMVKMKFNQ